MDTKKEKKQGFWASLFSSKSCSCSCGGSLIVEEKETVETACSCRGIDTEATQTASCCCTAMEVKVLGSGCSKCKATYSAIERVAKANNLDINLTKVDDIAEIMSYNIMTTPAVVVDGVVRLKGHVPTETEVKTLLGI